MRNYRVLVIDDEHEIPTDRLGKEGIDVDVVDNVEDAYRKILLGFHDLAVVDLDLPPTRAGSEELKEGELKGKDCCKYLCRFAPQTERVIRSKHIERLEARDVIKYPNGINVLPGTPLSSTIVKKGMFADSLAKIILPRKEFWEKKGVKVSFKNTPTLRKKIHGWVEATKHEVGPEMQSLFDPGGDLPYSKKSNTKLLKDSLMLEVEYLISKICGQQALPQLPFHLLELLYPRESAAIAHQSNKDVEREVLTSPLMQSIEVSELEKQGLSSAIIFRGQPKLFGVEVGVWLLIKIDVLSRIEQEVAAYNRYLRFVVSRSRRTELLGTALGNRLGAICYTYIGEPGKEPTQLELTSTPDDEAKILRIIENLFGSRDLHAIKSDEKTLGAIDYFEQRHRAENDWPALWSETLNFAKSMCPIDGKYDTLRPTETDRFESSYPTCLSHGDLHFGNVIGLDADSAVIIDYRDSGWAPRVIDYVVFESSLRVNVASEINDINRVVELNEANLELLSRLRGQTSQQDADSDTTRHANILRVAGERLYGNLQDSFDGRVTSAEYCSIALAWNLLLATNDQIDAIGRLAAALWAIDLGYSLVNG